MATCPRDGNTLESSPDLFGPGTRGLQCKSCRGLAADWDTAQRTFTALGLSLKDLHALVQNAKRREQASPIACPSCAHAMKPLDFRGVELDLCEACGTTWFDRDELKRISDGMLGQSRPPSFVGNAVGVFEMLWDCGYCGTKGLLGKTNRFCPHCGAQQDATARYFPKQGEEVAAVNHTYDGADRTCPACNTPNGRTSSHCRSCGSPLEGAAEVARIADRGSLAPAPQTASRSASKWPWVVGGVAVLAIALCLVSTFWTKDVAVTVTGHTWERTISIETLRAVQEDAWCDSMPSQAYSVSRSRAKRSTRQVADGQTCATRDVDRGDGTFERREECKTKYRDEPVYDDHCHFTVDRWQSSRTEKAAGRGTTPEPAWPLTRLSAPCSQRGCEREGSRTETYELTLSGEGKSYQCALPQQSWRTVNDGAKKTIPIGVVTGRPDCDVWK